jgi:hypothetical protein
LLVKSPAEGAVFAIYLGALLFGGVLIAASALGIGHDAHAGGGGDGDVHAGGGDGHDQGHGSNWLSLFGIRFWSFGTAFFGLTGLVLRGLGFSALAPFLGTAVGVAAGLGASATFRALSREVVGQVCSCRSRARSAARCGSPRRAAATSISSPNRTRRWTPAAPC